MPVAEINNLFNEMPLGISDNNSCFDDQARELLSMGCKRFGLEIGILSNIVGDTYRVVHQVSPESIALADEARFKLAETYCAVTLAVKQAVYFEHVANSRIRNHPAYAAFGLEAYFGIPIMLDGEVYGTLNFSSPEPRILNFTQEDIDTITKMAVCIENKLQQPDHGDPASSTMQKQTQL